MFLQTFFQFLPNNDICQVTTSKIVQSPYNHIIVCGQQVQKRACLILQGFIKYFLMKFFSYYKPLSIINFIFKI